MRHPWKKKNRGWAEHPLQRNSLQKAAVQKGSLLVALQMFVIGGSIISGLVFFYDALCRSDLFQVTAVEVVGNQEVDSQTIIQLTGIDANANLLALDLKAIKPKIQGYSWIEEVTLRKEFPSRLHITVRERRPVALLNTSKGLFYVDSKGEPFVGLNGQTEIDFPVITGLENELSFTGKMVEVTAPDKVRAALQFIGYAAKGTSALPAQNISEIHCDEKQGVILFLADRPFPIFLGKELGKKAYNHLAKVLYWLYKKKEFQNVAYIRLDYMDNKILVGKESDKKTAETKSDWHFEWYDFSAAQELTRLNIFKTRG